MLKYEVPDGYGGKQNVKAIFQYCKNPLKSEYWQEIEVSPKNGVQELRQ